MNTRPASTSLIISTYNWPGALELVLLSVLRQSGLPSEILIADDGSNETTAKLIRSFSSRFNIPVKHIWHEDIGFRKTIILNRAVQASSGEYIIQIDGDSILHRQFIDDHIRLAETKAFIRGTRAHLLPSMTKSALESKRIDFHFYSPGVKHRNNAFHSRFFSAFGIRKAMSSDSVRGSNLSFWKEDFIQVNGYNNDLAGWGHEDEELAVRLINNKVIKKKVKFSCVQYHLFHPVAAGEHEPEHRQAINTVKRKKIIKCANGFAQLNETTQQENDLA